MGGWGGAGEEGKSNCDRWGYLVGFSGASKYPCKCHLCSQISHRDHIEWRSTYKVIEY